MRSGIRTAAGLSGHLYAVQAAEQAAQQCAAGLDGIRPDIAFVFFSPHHVEAAQSIVHAIERRLNPAAIIGVSAEAVLGGETEMEGAPGMSILAASLPGVTIKPFAVDQLPMARPDSSTDLQALRETAGLGRDHRATFFFADPYTVPVNHLLPAMSQARSIPDPLAAAGVAPLLPRGERLGPILGGMASAAQKPGGNVLILNDRILRSGGVGVSLGGRVRVDSLVSQGCKPIGPTFIVTGVRGQLITGLGGRPAIEALTEILDGLNEQQRHQLRRGLFLGRAISEYKKRFGRDDFLIRNVYGVDQSNGAIAVMDLLKVGQTVQFHLRDQTTASEDLALLLDAQQLYDPPAGALLFTCNGRGTRLFDHPNHDAKQISRAFASVLAGEDAAKAGFPVTPAATRTGGPGPLPLAGFFAAGEIGPVEDQVFVHGQTACLALFREL
jgi:small ligand-binding sensory domain FIST